MMAMGNNNILRYKGICASKDSLPGIINKCIGDVWVVSYNNGKGESYVWLGEKKGFKQLILCTDDDLNFDNYTDKVNESNEFYIKTLLALVKADEISYEKLERLVCECMGDVNPIAFSNIEYRHRSDENYDIIGQGYKMILKHLPLKD